jgi:NADPH2:quinone reductase
LKAIQCRTYGPPEALVLAEVDAPPIAAGHVRVRIQYCSLNFPDALMIQGQHQYKYAVPFVPGGEISGTVSEVGEGVETFCVGDCVAALCFHGGFSQEAVVPVARVCKLPAGVPMSEACCLIGTYGTAIHALAQRGSLSVGETLLILGAAGGSGAAAVQVGKLLGARIIAAVSSDAKKAFALACGADEAISYSAAPLKEALRSLVGTKGVDVIYDPVGGEHAETALRCMAWNGRYLVVGFAGGIIPTFKANLPLLKGCAIFGVFTGEFITREPDKAAANTRQLLQWVSDGRLKVAVSEIVTLAQVPAALRKLLNREAMGKIVAAVP